MPDTDKTLLLARVRDAIEICYRKNFPQFVGFLDDESATLVENTVLKLSVNFKMFGGYDGAERLMFGVFPEYFDIETGSFPITPITISNKAKEPFSHRDVLGTLMSLGIKREMVGDIIVGMPDTVVFVHNNIAEFVLTNVEKIRSCKVELKRGINDSVSASKKFEDATDTVASLRLDCVIAALCNCSRTKAEELISNSLVFLNGTVSEKTTKQVTEGDKISVRGKGKYIIGNCNEISKRKRIILHFKKYI